ncbi:hypothetical protein [Paracholeplasma morum]|uniref:hypothetical protein n=1 Tax=Paracholeplasma morum TaxID=264637 RepID=UPI001957003C|nr:hypothetical protein [Paracholeplasma morum]
MTISDRGAYAQMITYSTKDMLGVTRTYVICYNELILVEPIEETNDETTYKFLAYIDKDNFIKIMYESEEEKMIVTVIQDELTGENLFRYEIMNKNGDKGDFTGHKNPNRGGGNNDHDDDEKYKGNQDDPGHKKMNRIGLL